MFKIKIQKLCYNELFTTVAFDYVNVDHHRDITKEHIAALFEAVGERGLSYNFDSIADGASTIRIEQNGQPWGRIHVGRKNAKLMPPSCSLA